MYESKNKKTTNIFFNKSLLVISVYITGFSHK